MAVIHAQNNIILIDRVLPDSLASNHGRYRSELRRVTVINV